MMNEFREYFIYAASKSSIRYTILCGWSLHHRPGAGDTAVKKTSKKCLPGGNLLE